MVVPGTNGRRGIETAAVFGALAGDPEKKLEVLTRNARGPVQNGGGVSGTPGKMDGGKHLKTDAKLHMIVEVWRRRPDVVRAERKDRHTNIVRIEKDGEDIFRACPAVLAGALHRSFVYAARPTFSALPRRWTLSRSATASSVRSPCNEAISNDGLTHVYGSNVGKTPPETCGTGLWTQIKAAAAAGSDARMSGSLLPVVINSALR